MNFIINVFIVLLGLQASLATLPIGITGCQTNLSSTAFDSCVKTQWEALGKYLTGEIPSLNLERLDAFNVPIYTFKKKSVIMSVDAMVSNFYGSGLSKLRVDKVHVDPTQLSLDAVLSLPELYAAARYNVKGKVMMYKLPNIGLFTGNFTDTKAHISAKARVVRSAEGVEHLEFVNFRIHVDIGPGSFILHSKTRQDTLYAQKFMNLFKKNRRLFLVVASPIIDEITTGVFRQLVDKALTTLRKDELFLN